MAATFSRTLRSLSDDTSGASLATMGLAALLLVAWGGWFVGAKVRLLETSETARLETAGVAHPIQPWVTGKVTISNLSLDREVHAGDVLVEIDSRAEQLQLDEAREKLAADVRQLEFLHRELEDDEAAQSEDRQASRAALAVSRARAREAAARSRLASEESTRLDALKANGHLGEMEAMRAAAEAAGRTADAEANAQDAARAAWDVRKRGSERRAMIERLYRDIAAAEGERAQLGARIEQLEHEIERHKVRSAVDGRIGELVPLPEGSVVQAGSKLGAVVPPGDLKVVAEFAAATAIGRVEPGDPAQIRLAGFPWAEYGVLRATVVSVGSEPREGRIRAELHIDSPSSTRIPIQHGLSGVAEVEVERTSPARLVLRTVGAALAPSRRAPKPVSAEPAPAPQAALP